VELNVEHELTLRVANRRDVADRVAELILAPVDARPLPSWAPGAHVDLVLGEGMVRQHSLCGDPSDAANWRIAVLHEPNGRGGSTLVHERLQQGETVPVRGPRNHFALRDGPRLLFIAGGIGITPILPMIAAADAAGCD
jgi:ferredoxin-NADP reductase